MTKKQLKILEAVLIAFEIVWSEYFTPEDIGTEKYVWCNGHKYCMFPDDYKVIKDLLKEFNYVEVAAK